MKRTYFLVTALLFLLAACSDGGGAGSDSKTPVRITMKIPAAEKASAPTKPVSEGVRSVRARAERSGGAGQLDSDTRNVEAGQTLEMELNVAAGLGHLFTVEAFSGNNGDGPVLFRGTKTVDVVAGTTPSVTIDMQAVNSDIQVLPKNPRVIKTTTEVFTVTGVSPGDVSWRLQEPPQGFETLIGSIDENTGLYTAPPQIPYVFSDTEPLGVPLGIVVEAFDPGSGAVRGSTRIRVIADGTVPVNLRQQITPPGTGQSTTRSRSSGQRNVAYYEGNAYAVWEQGGQILFSETLQSGSSPVWTDPVPLSSSRTGQERAAITVGPEGHLYVVYTDCSTCSGFSTIVLLQRKAGESNFVRLPLGDGNDNTGLSSQNPTVAVSPNGNTVYVAWSANRSDSENDIFFQRIDPVNAARIDALPTQIINNPDDAREQPTMDVARDGKVYLAWVAREISTSFAPNRIMATVSRNADAQFDAEVQVNEIPSFTTFDRRPTLAAGDTDTVHIAWEKDVVGDSIFRVAYDKGTLGADGLSFGDDEALGRFFLGTGNNRYEQFNPSIAWDGGEGVYIALQEETFDSATQQVLVHGIFLAKKVAANDPFDSRARVDHAVSSDEALNRELPALAVDETGRAFVIWTDKLGGTPPNYIWFAVTEILVS